MAYIKPGITVSQEQQSQTPILTPPDLEGVVVGNGYWWQDISWDNEDDSLHHSVAPETFDGVYVGDAGDTDTTLALSSINATHYDLVNDDNANLVIVDLLGISGDDTGKVIRLTNGSLHASGDFTVSSSTNLITFDATDTLDTTLTGTVDVADSDVVSEITIDAGLTDFTADTDLAAGDYVRIGSDVAEITSVAATSIILASQITVVSGTAWAKTRHSTYQIKVGYRAKNDSAQGYHFFTTQSEITNSIGSIVSWNPLAYGADIAMRNSASYFNAVGIDWSATEPETVAAALEEHIAAKDIYALGILYTGSGVDTAVKTHVEAYSVPTEKKERIAFVNNELLSQDPSAMSSQEKLTHAETVRDGNAALASKRLFSTYPSLAYVVETRHTSTIHPDWIAASMETETSRSTIATYAKFAATVTINGVQYKEGQNITSTIHAALMTAGWGGNDGFVTVLAPVPGFYFNAQAAGQVVGTIPSQPLTNVAGSGMYMTHGSQDLFTESMLNVMAEGGTWIMTQNASGLPIYCRHQMSTDITSVAKREMSITKALDYTAKFIRSGLRPYIGNRNITPAFLKLVETILIGIGFYLKREGYIEDLKVLSVEQDEFNPDTINVVVNIKVLYPVNYIKVKLVF